MMRLLIVSREQKNDRVFGLGKTVGRIANELRELGHFVEYITTENWKIKEHKAFEQYTKIGGFVARLFCFKDFVIPAFSERLVQGVTSAKMHLIQPYTHIWFQDPWIAVGFLCKISLTFGAKKCAWGVSEHGLGSFAQAVVLDGLALDDKWMKLLLKIERFILAKATFVWTPSNQAMQLLARDLGYAQIPKKWQCIGYGKPNINVIDKNQARQLLRWDKNKIYVLAVGRVAPVKRFDMLILACALVQDEVPNIQLVIVGGEHNIALADTATKAGLVNAPIYCLTQDIGIYLSAADIYVSGCEFESFGMANMEAVCAELPCIIAAGGGSIEVVSYGGWLCHANSNSLSKALSQIATNNEMKEFYKMAAKKRSNEYKEWEEIIQIYEQFLLGAK